MKPGKYTVQEVIEAAGFDKLDDYKSARITVAGVQGVNEPDRLIKLQPGTYDVVVGNETKQVEVTDDEFVISDSARKVLDAKGAERTEAAEKLAQNKANSQNQENSNEESKTQE